MTAKAARPLRLELADNFAKSRGVTYHAAVLGVLGRRGVEAGISVFALLGFCYVPLGQHTGLEHAEAIFSTPAAKHAGAELMEAFAHVRAKLTGEAVEFASSEAAKLPSAQPSAHHAEGSRPEHAHHEPKARLPHLGADSNAHLAPQAPLLNLSDANAPDASVPWRDSESSNGSS